MIVCIAMMPVAVFADNATGEGTASLETVEINVEAGNIENDYYKIGDGFINLIKTDVQYVLTGTTDRKIQIWGSNSTEPVKTFHIRLNNARINGGIDINNSDGAKLVVEVGEGKTNYVKKIYAVDLTITGKGTLESKDLGVTQQSTKDTRLASSLYIKDTIINVAENGNPSQWNGACVLDGDTVINYNNEGDYASLQLGQSDNFEHSLTMKGNSRLYCLHSNAAAASENAVDGLSTFKSSINLQDNAYLEAQGRAGNGKYVGNALICNDISVNGNATLKASAQGVAINIFNDVNINGGNIIADSKNSNGIYAEGKIDIRNANAEITGYYPAIFGKRDVNINGGKVIAYSKNSNGIYAGGKIDIRNANAEITGYYPAIFGNSNVLIENSLLKANSTGDVAVYSREGDITLKNSLVDANGADGHSGIYSENGVKASGSWIETTGTETLDNTPDSIENSVLFNGMTGKVIGNHSINKDVTVSDDMVLTVPQGTSVTVLEEKTLTNNGIINIETDGKFIKEGTVTNKGIIINPTDTFDFGEAKSGYSSVDSQILLEKGDGEYDVSLTDDNYELVHDNTDIMIRPKTELAAGEYNKKLEIKIAKNDATVMTLNRNAKFKVTAAYSGGYYNPVQKPEISAGEGGNAALEDNGTTLVITPDEGMQVSKVTVNGNEVSVTDNKVTGLKTGDKVEVTFTKIPPTKEELDKEFKEKAGEIELVVRTSKTSKNNIKVTVKLTPALEAFIKEIKSAGYTVKYKFYRSANKSSKYAARITKEEAEYLNTEGKKDKKYYYKAKLLIYDNEGNLVAQTELKQCRYGLRTWSK